MADDAGHMGHRYAPWINTPVYDMVCSKGVEFLNAYTCNSKSAPSRAATLTGRNSWQLGAAANHWCEFPLDIKTLPEGLMDHGYEAAYTGKGWGPGIAMNADSTDRHLTGTPYNDIKHKAPTKGINKIDYAANFNAFLEERDKDKPFIFWYGSREPHRPYEWESSVRYGKTPAMIESVPGYWPDNDTVRRDMLDYAVEIEYFDSQMGEILNSLQARGLLDNTLVIVTSDHGMPFPRCKGNDYLDAMHVPLAVMWGDNVVSPGRVDDSVISLIDLAPTILEACGSDARELGMMPVTGRSFLDLLTGVNQNSIERNYILMGRERHDPGRPGDAGYPIRALLCDSMLYIHNFEPSRWPAGNPSTGYMDCDGSPTKTQILQCRLDPCTHHYWELCMGKRPAHELFNIKRDPWCLHNLACDDMYADILASLRAQLQSRLLDEGDPRAKGNGAVFDTYPNRCPAHDFYDRTAAGETGLKTGWINRDDFEPGID